MTIIYEALKKAEKNIDAVTELKKNKVVHIDDGVVAENETDEKILSLGKDLKFSPRRIKSFIRRKAPASMLRIRTRSGREIVTTKYHPFFSINYSIVLRSP